MIRACAVAPPGPEPGLERNVPGFGSLIIGQQGIKTRATQVLLSAQKPFTKESGWGTSIAYTWTTARHNRDINEKYAFDRGLIGDYPTIRSNGAPRHRLVVTGSYAGFWGITFGGKITLATPTAVNDWYPVMQASGYTLPTPQAAVPNATGKFLVGGKIFGYRSVDLQATKTFAGGQHRAVRPPGHHQRVQLRQLLHLQLRQDQRQAAGQLQRDRRHHRYSAPGQGRSGLPLLSPGGDA